MRTKKCLSLILALCLSMALLAGLAGCGAGGGDAAAPTDAAAIRVTDSRGVTVELARPAERIVCLLNSGLNDLLMLGCGDRIVGIDEWTYTNDVTYRVLSQLDARIAAREIPAVDGNLEEIIRLQPDVVIIWAQDDEKISALESNGIPVVGIQVNSFDEVFDKMRMLAAVVGKEPRGEELIRWTQGVLDEIDAQVSTLDDADRKTGIFVWGASRLDLAGAASTGHSMLQLCGITDCAAGIDEEHFVARMEDVVQWDPASILMWNIADLDPQDYLDDSQWANITAIRERRVFEIPDDKTFYSDLWTVKYVYAVQYFAKCVYPDLFAGQDMDVFLADMMTTLYGKTAD